MLIILSIAVSAALYFASISISDTIVKVQTARWRASVGYTNITVNAWWESPSRYFSPEAVSDMDDYMDYIIGTVSGYGIYKYGDDHKLGMSLWGIDFDDMNHMAEVGLKSKSDLYPFVGKKIIISSYTADKFRLKAGDSIQININGINQKFRICAIARKVGPFIGDGESVTAVVPPDTIRSLYNVRGKVDNLFLKLKNPANKAQFLKIIGNRYPKYHVTEPFTAQEIREQNNKIKMPFLALTIILSFMSIYIINSTFRVITFERLPDIGTFRSIGARKSKLNRMLLMESLIYGSAGGIVGCLLGVVVLYFMSIFTMPTWDVGYHAAISFEPKQLLLTFLLAVGLCLVSSVSPILKINKIPIKDIVLNVVESQKSSKIVRAVIGIIITGFGIFAPILVKGNSSMYINTICIVAVIAGLVLLVPFFTRIAIKFLGLIYAAVFGNIGKIAVKNLRGNRSAYGSISLLAIGISCILFVNILSYSTLSELDNYYNRCTYQIFMSAKNVDMEYLQKLRSVPGVEDVSKVMSLGGLEILNKNGVIGVTHGVDTKNYLSYNDLPLAGNRQDYLDLLDKGRGILIANRLRDRYDLKVGEELKLRAWGKVTNYKVIGFFESIENGGDFGIVSDKYMKLDMGWSDEYYSIVLIKTNADPDKVVENIKSQFAKQQPYVKTVKEVRQENIRYNEQLYLIAKGFSIITMLAGILGIFNNLIINFIQRRRHLAMYRSVGMSKLQIIGMIFIEALTLGLIGSLIGVTSGLLMISSGAGLLRSLQMEMNIHYSDIQLALCIILGIAISIIASVWPALKSSKLNLMESIKYE